LAHMLAIVDMAGGLPNVDPAVTPYVGHNLIWQIGGANGYGLYMFSGLVAQLTALNALSQVRGLVVMTDNGVVKWAELDNVITTAHRTKLNTWLTARGYPNIPAGWTYRQVVRAIIRRLRAYGDDTDEFADSVLNGTWVADV